MIRTRYGKLHGKLVCWFHQNIFPFAKCYLLTANFVRVGIKFLDSFFLSQLSFELSHNLRHKNITIYKL